MPVLHLGQHAPQVNFDDGRIQVGLPPGIVKQLHGMAELALGRRGLVARGQIGCEPEPMFGDSQ